MKFPAAIALRFKSLAVFLLSAISILAPCLSIAQQGLAVQWAYSPISKAKAVAYSPDGTLMVVAGAGGIQVYAASTCTLLRGIPTAASGAVSAVAISPDGKTLAVGGYSTASVGYTGVLELRSLSSGQLIASLNTATTNASSVAFSPDGKTLASGGGFALLELWSVPSGALIMTLPSAEDPVNAVAFSPDGTTLADGGVGFSVELWNYTTGTQLSSIATELIPVNSVTFSADGSMLADGGAGATGGMLEVWSVTSGKRIRLFDSHANASVNSVAISPDGTTLGVGGWFQNGPTVAAGVLELWGISTGKRLDELVTSENGGVYSVAFSPDGTTLAAVGGHFAGVSNGGKLEQWGVLNGNRIVSVDTSAYASSIAFSPDGLTMAAGGGSDLTLDGLASGGSLQLWNVRTGTLITTLATAAEGGVNSVFFSPDDTTLAVGGGDANNSAGILELWNVSTGKLIRKLATAAAPVNSIAISPDGTVLVVGGGGNFKGSPGVLELWSIGTGKLMAALPTEAGNAVASVALSPDGQTLVDGGSAGDPFGVVEKWDVKTHALIQEFVTANDLGVTAVAIPPSGKGIADVGYSDRDSYPSDLEFLEVGPPLVRATGFLFLRGVIGDSNGKIIIDSGRQITGGGGLEERDISSGNLINTVSSGGSDVSSVAFPPDGSRLAYSDVTSGIVVAANPFYGTVPVSGITLNPPTLAGGDSSTGTVTLTQAAPGGGDVVNLRSSSLAMVVPPSVTVPVGATSATFPIVTNPVTTGTVVNITASSGNVPVSAALTITTSLASVSVSPISAIGGNSATGKVSLTGPAPSGGLTVGLSTDSASASTPPSVFVAEGTAAATFAVSTTAVAANVIAHVSATLGGGMSTATFTVTPGTSLLSITRSPASLVGGATATGNVTLSAPTPSTGITVSFASSDPSVSLPASVPISAGGTSAPFAITTHGVSAYTMVTISASYNGVTRTIGITVEPPALTYLLVSPASVIGGSSTVVTGTVGIATPAPTGGIEVPIHSDSSFATVPATVLIPAGATSAPFTITTTSVSTTGVANISSTMGSHTKSAPLTVKP